MGAFSRMRYVIAANLNALIEKAENPEKLLRALIREMEDAGEDARLAAADLLAERDHLERTAAQLERELSEWQDRAEQAVAAGRDDLARAALKARAELGDTLETTRGEHRLLVDRVGHLEADMATLKGKLAEAKTRLRDMQKRGKAGTAPAPRAARLSPGERRMQQAMGRFERLQSQVERLEARVRSYEVGGFAPPAWESGGAADDPSIEAELQALKARIFDAPEPERSGQGEPREA